MPLSFIESPFTTKAEYEMYLKGEVSLPEGFVVPEMTDVSDAVASMSVASSQAWGPLEYPPARKAKLQADFEAQAGAGRMALKQVHALIFSDEERKEYGFDNFDEDLQATSDGTCKDDMSWADVLKFMEENL